jgi:hypothetical protein
MDIIKNKCLKTSIHNPSYLYIFENQMEKIKFKSIRLYNGRLKMKRKILIIILVILLTLVGIVLADPYPPGNQTSSLQPVVELQVSPPSN